MKLLTIVILLFATSAFADCRVFKMTDKGVVCDERENKARAHAIANVFMVAGSAVDCYTTVKAVRAGATEVNPLMRPFANNFWSCFGVKSAIMLPVGVFGWRNDSIKGQIAIGAIGSGLGVWNSFQF